MIQIIPQRLAVKYSPPRVCLIYKSNNEEFFHDFPINPQDMNLPTDKLYNKLNIANPGYLDQIDKDQVCGLLELIKKNCHKSSKAQRLRGIVTGYREGDNDSPKQDYKNSGAFDYAQVEKHFNANSDKSDSDADLQL